MKAMERLFWGLLLLIATPFTLVEAFTYSVRWILSGLSFPDRSIFYSPILDKLEQLSGQ